MTVGGPGGGPRKGPDGEPDKLLAELHTSSVPGSGLMERPLEDPMAPWLLKCHFGPGVGPLWGPDAEPDQLLGLGSGGRSSISPFDVERSSHRFHKWTRRRTRISPGWNSRHHLFQARHDPLTPAPWLELNIYFSNHNHGLNLCQISKTCWVRNARPTFLPLFDNWQKLKSCTNEWWIRWNFIVQN